MFQLPIPNEVKATGFDEDVEDIEEDEDEVSAGGGSGAGGSGGAKITSNLVSAEELKRTASSVVVGGPAASAEASNNRADLHFLTKENKTLNVNVLAAEYGGGGHTIPNNKINFDSEKFHHDPTAINQRNSLQNKAEKIDNNLNNKDTKDTVRNYLGSRYLLLAHSHVLVEGLMRV